MCRKFTLSLLLLAFAGVVHAQAIWAETTENNIPQKGERRIVPQVYRTFRLDPSALQPVLASAPERFTAAAAKGKELPVLEIPMPDGRTSRFRLTESPVMASGLQAQFPEIRCYTGRGIDDPTAMLKCDFTPHGFHAMITSALHSTVFLDPYSQGDTEHYVVYFKKDYLPKDSDTPFACATQDEDLQELTLGDAASKVLGDCQLRRYRLALACSGEYSVFHGGTTVLALAAMNTTMNRVNGVYENDLAITMQIINNNTQVIYLSGGSDPYSNGNAGAMINENQTNVTNVIGSANFDIGHVFGTNSGGVAGLGVVCSNGSKARGVTGSGSPVGDPFDIDYVAHEMGHQFGGPHSFNGTASSCNGNGSAANAVEPGSGTTIMAYAGICGSQDVQPNSDDYFHANSIQRITAYAINGNGNNCPVKIATNNTNPVVNGGPDYTIPKSTPFALTATGSDVDGDTLTYCWEQMDAALGTPNPPAATNATGPLFRSFKGVASPTRWFPRLSDLVNNTNYAWEELPGVARNMNFRVVLRDNNDGAGCTAEDNVLVTVTAGAGPFVVTVPNTNVLWQVGEIQSVTWDVSNTDLAPVNCANVRILLSTDGGFTYPVVLAASVPNTGSANVLVPNNLSNTCRVKVESIGNIFFDISNVNFRIQQPPVPTFSLVSSLNSVKACAGDTIAFTLDVGSVLNFSDPVQFDVSGAPAGASVQFTPNPAIPGNGASVSIAGLTPAMAGNYTMTITGTSGSIVKTVVVQMNLLPGIPDVTSALSPLDGASGQLLNVNLNWNAVPFAESYTVQLASSPSFAANTIVYTSTGSGANVLTPALQGGAVYYWRVKAANYCGQSDYTPAYAFQTGNILCNQIFNSEDVPKNITGDSASTIVSILTIPDSKNIADVDVTLVANHSYVGDLDAKLVAPTGDTVRLFDRPGYPTSAFGCSGNNMTLIFNDVAAQTAAMLEAMCNTVNPALLGEFQPISPLAILNSKNVQGDWQLLMRDNSTDDGGNLIAWGLTLCFSEEIPSGVLAINNPLTVGAGGSGNIDNTHLSFTGNAGLINYTLLSTPQHGTLMLNGAPLAIGGAFTQDDIDFNLLTYTHNGDGATSDDFLFDALDLTNFSWVHQSTFNIVVVQNNLAATAVQTQAVTCPGSATAQITVTASGLDGQYEYSLNGGPNQASNVFDGLVAGAYTVVITGQFGFTATSNVVTISDPVAITASTSVAGDDITVTASGGTGTYEYSADGVNFQASNVLENLANGIYTVTVRDGNGCTATAQAIVAVNSLLATLELQTAISCFGGSNGAVSVTTGGGQAPLQYSLNGGAYQSSNVFTGLPEGNYTVVVQDNQGFTTTTNAVALTTPGAINASASANLNVVTATASGGTGTFEYSIDGTTFQASNTFEGLANGDYTVTVRDANGCTATTTVTVSVGTLAVTSADISGVILCYGDATAVITVNATGGIPPYEYALDGGAYQSGNTFTGVGGGAHVVTVRDALGTVAQSGDINVVEPAPVQVVAIVNGNDVQILTTGGTGPVTFTCNCPTPSNNLPNGDYSVTATDANGCTGTTTFSVNLPPVTASVQTISTDPCVPSATIEVTASGGEAPYEYSLNGGAFQSGNTFTVFPGQNNVRVRDVTGAIVQIPVNVTLPPPVQAAAAAQGDSIVASAQFGTQPYQYSIDGVTFQSSPIFPDLPDGTYTVTVKDDNGCTDTETVVVNTIGTTDPGAAWGLVVSPNPGAGLFRLEMLQAPSTLRAEVFDAAGRIIRALDYSSSGGHFSVVLDLQDLAQGIYVLRLTDGTNWGSVRLSVIR